MRDIDLLASHLIGDYILQTDEMAREKLTDPYVRARHVTRYCLPFLIGGLLTNQNPKRLAIFLTLNWITHFVTDSKRWLPNDEWAPGTILNDQALHVIQLAILSRLLNG